MKSLLTIFFAVALGLNLNAQVPDYVMNEALVGWWPFEGNYDDLSGNNNHCNLIGSVPFVEDRNGVPSSAISFLGNGSYFLRVIYSQESFTFTQGLSISAWVNSNSGSGDRRALQMGATDNGGKGFHILKRNSHLGYKLAEGGANDPAFGLWSGSSATTPINLGEWHHIVFSVNFASLQWNTFLDGVLVESGISPIPFQENQIPLVFTQTFEIGRKMGTSNNGDAWSGFIDDIGIWNRALTEAEILALYNADPPVAGCTDLTACNYNEEATSDDGSCIPSGCMETAACNYNELAECQGEECVYSCCPGPGCCGEGMFWDYELEQCQIFETCQEDLDGDGVIGINDLMELLSSFGTMCEEPETGEFTCGNPMNYHGYDYATVQIGEQCWFAENLRAENYRNGDAIPADLSDAEWASTTDGAVSVYDGDMANLSTYGSLYNWHAASDARSVCPSGWHIPNEADWQILELLIGVPENELDLLGLRGSDQGRQLKADSDLWNTVLGIEGTDIWGFKGLPGGERLDEGFIHAGNYGYWWTNTLNDDGDKAFFRELTYNHPEIYRHNGLLNSGMSVRCIKDTE